MVVVLYVDTMGAGVYIEPLLPEEANQGDAGVFGVPDGQTGGRAYGCHNSYACHGGFLDQLETCPAA